MRTAEAFLHIFNTGLAKVVNRRTALHIEGDPKASAAALRENLTSQSGGLPQAGERDIDDDFTACAKLGFGGAKKRTVVGLIGVMSEEFLV